MQRLRKDRSALRRRLAGEHGASAVLLALLLVPILGFTAIAVDVGALYAEKARLQVAADSAALAVAADCAKGACGDMQATAVSATATVAWGGPSRGTAVLPLTFSWCEFRQQTGGGLPSSTTAYTIFLTKSSNTIEDCTGPSDNVVPGGFGYLVTDPGQCRATSAVAGRSTSSTGNTPPSDCSTADFTRFLGSTVLLPIFDQFGETGSNAWYRVYGYAAFRITGYSLGGQFSTTPRPCGGNDRCISGYFTRFVELSDDFVLDPGAPDLGAAVLRLIR